jgi:transcriptional regulator with XRE-family HTH domain
LQIWYIQPVHEPGRDELNAVTAEALRALGRRIKALREQRRLTQDEFAQRCHISVSFASLLERGERSPSLETLVQAAAALDVPTADLFRDQQQEAFDPYFFRLIEFAQVRGLSHLQVNRWIAVGSAMFDPNEGEERREAPRPTDATTCSAPGCDRAVLAKGLCKLHYHRLRRARL